MIYWIQPAKSFDWTSLNTFGMNWNAEHVPDPIGQNQSLTSLMLFCLNGSKSLQPCSSIQWKAFPEECKLLGRAINASGFEIKCPRVWLSTYFCLYCKLMQTFSIKTSITQCLLCFSLRFAYNRCYVGFVQFVSDGHGLSVYHYVSQ